MSVGKKLYIPLSQNIFFMNKKYYVSLNNNAYTAKIIVCAKMSLFPESVTYIKVDEWEEQGCGFIVRCVHRYQSNGKGVVLL